MKNYTFDEVTYILLKKVCIALLVIAAGVHVLDTYWEVAMVVIGYTFITIGFIYIGIIGIAAIRLSKLYKSRG